MTGMAVGERSLWQLTSSAHESDTFQIQSAQGVAVIPADHDLGLSNRDPCLDQPVSTAGLRMTAPAESLRCTPHGKQGRRTPLSCFGPNARPPNGRSSAQRMKQTDATRGFGRCDRSAPENRDTLGRCVPSPASQVALNSQVGDHLYCRSAQGNSSRPDRHHLAVGFLQSRQEVLRRSAGPRETASRRCRAASSATWEAIAWPARHPS
jgi:hypothetical protein